MKWGLIGASTIASQFMIDAIHECDGEIVAVQSGNVEYGKHFALEHHIPQSVSSLSELLKDLAIEAVYISSTNEKHLPQALAAIEAGKHVLCEKPIAMSLSEARQMVLAARDRGVVLATNHHLRNAGSHLKMKEIIDGGTIGNIISMRIFHAVLLPVSLQGWRISAPSAGGGVILDIVVHDADIVRFYLDEDPQEVVAIAQGETFAQGVEDSNMSVWTMPSGVMVQTHESFTHEFAQTGIELYGTKGAIIARNVMTQRPVGEIELRTSAGSEQIEFSTHSLYARSVRKFLEAVSGVGRPAADGIDGAKSLAVAAAVLESAATGKRTKVQYEVL